MTGIERLREFAKGCRLTGQKAYSNAIGDIADQIEREQACDGDTAENIRLIVGGVVDEMERHVLGHEGMDDSPVARWARELREALGRHCRDGEGDTVAWVREHGGLDYVMHEWQSRVPRDSYEMMRQRLLDHIAECETALGRRNRRIAELGHRVSDLTTENAELRRRAMPEGMEWPKYTDGKPVRFNDELDEFSATIYKTVKTVIFQNNGYSVIDNDGGSANVTVVLKDGERVKRPAPKVLDADGAEIRVGDRVLDTRNGDALVVHAIEDEGHTIACRYVDVDDGAIPVHGMWSPSWLTHRAPVLAADGKPLREGGTVWSVDSGIRYTVEKTTDELIPIKCRSEMGTTVSLYPSQLTHERPDSWERLEEDAKKGVCKYFDQSDGCGSCPHYPSECHTDKARDIVRRAKALAERERCE